MSLIATLLVTAADAAHESASGLPQLDTSSWPSQLFWLAISFGFLYWLMSSYFLPRIGGTLEERKDRIADDLDQAAESRRMAEEAETAYNRALADARAKAQVLAGETRDSVNGEIAAMQASMEKNLGAKATAAEEQIAQMKKEAAGKVRVAVADTTKAIVEALIHETPSESAVDAAVGAVSKP